MRPLLLAVLLLSCVRDPSRRSQVSSQAAAPLPVIAASDAPVAASQPTATSQPTAASQLVAASQPTVVAAIPPPAAPVDPRASTRQAAHDVLAEHCGECHEGHRSNKPKALAVFDLDQPDWPGRFDAHRFESALGRLAKKPEPASAVFIAFRDAELASAPTAAN